MKEYLILHQRIEKKRPWTVEDDKKYVKVLEEVRDGGKVKRLIEVAVRKKGRVSLSYLVMTTHRPAFEILEELRDLEARGEITLREI